MKLLPIKLALTSLNSNRGRSLLTILGIVIGITAVIAVLSTGQAIKGLIVGEVEAFGSNFLQVEVKTPNTKQASVENAISMVGGSIISTMKEKEVGYVSIIDAQNKKYGVLESYTKKVELNLKKEKVKGKFKSILGTGAIAVLTFFLITK